MIFCLRFWRHSASRSASGCWCSGATQSSERFASLVGRRAKPSGTLLQNLVPAPQASVETIVKPFQNLLPRSPEEVSVVQKRLIRAGYRDRGAVNIFYGAKVVVPMALALLVTVTGAFRIGPFFVYAIAIGIGFMLPDFWLGNRIANRQYKIRIGLPEALDLMVICSEAGLGLDQTLRRVGEELQTSQPEIRDEFQLLGLEQKAGRTREEALLNFAVKGEHRQRSLAGHHADSVGHLRHQYLENVARLFGHVAYTKAAASGRNGGEDHR